MFADILTVRYIYLWFKLSCDQSISIHDCHAKEYFYPCDARFVESLEFVSADFSSLQVARAEDARRSQQEELERLKQEAGPRSHVSRPNRSTCLVLCV